jgi:UDP-glucose 4-epimerase
VDNFSTGKRQNLHDVSESVELYEIDINDGPALSAACAGVDTIFHEAAIPSVPRSVADPLASHRANIDGTLGVLIAARDAGVRRVIYAGSSSAYGDTPTLPKTEGLKPNPLSPYAVQKLAGELYMSSFQRVYGMETVSLRYFNVFGPRQDEKSHYAGVLAKFITLMLQKQTPTIQGSGEQSRDFTYVDNVVQANMLAAAAPAANVVGRTFNIATGVRCSLNETFELLKELTEYSGGVLHDASRKGDVMHSLADITAAREAFGYEPVVNFREGLRRTVAWYRDLLSHDLHVAGVV